MKFLVVKKKKLNIFIAVLLLTVFCLIVFLPIIRSYNIIKNYEEKWKIEFSKTAQFEFFTSMTYIDGSVNYSAFTCKAPPDELLNYIKQKHSYKFEENFSFAINSLLISNKIPKKYLPDFTKPYSSARLESSYGIRCAYLYIIYFPDSKKLILCQDISQYPY